MKHTAKRFVSALLVAVMAVTAVFSFASCGKDSDETFKIGISGPLTGGAAVYGEATYNGAKLAIDEINAAGGLYGYKLELLSYDDEHKADKVSDGYYKQIEDGMQVSLGCTTSAPCAEYVKLASEDNVFVITPSASNDEIPKAANSYQICFADGNQGKAAAQFVNDKYNGKTIGILYCKGDNYSEGIYNQLVDNLSGVQHVDASFTDATGKDTINFSQQIETLKSCEFIFMPIYYTPASQFMTQAKTATNNNMKVYYGCDGLDGIDGGVEGFDIKTIDQEISYLSHFDANATSGTAKTFIDAYKTAYGEAPIQFAAGAYDCVYAIFNALKAAFSENDFDVNVSAADVCKALQAQFDGSFTYSGATGSNMKWTRATSGYGYVEKEASKSVVKESTAK